MNWESIYRRKVSSAEEAVSAIQSGDRIYLGGGSGVPIELIQGLTGRGDELRDVEITRILTFADAPYVKPEYQAAFWVNALFIGPNVSQAVQKGPADFTPFSYLRSPAFVKEASCQLMSPLSPCRLLTNMAFVVSVSRSLRQNRPPNPPGSSSPR